MFFRIVILFFLITISGLAADSTYYVDGDWTGTESGTQSQPWQTINWTTVNTSLSSGNVTIYLSAREAGSDTDDSYDNGTGTPIEIDCNGRTDSGANRLTISGNEFYNSNDSTPSWSAYSGSSKCRVKKIDAQNASLTKRSYITLHGIHVIQTGDDKALVINGDHVVVENCDVEFASGTYGTSAGPAVLIVPTADAAHEGSSEPASALTDIIIRFNTVHDTAGEAIYVGGGGAPPLTDPGAGYPSHSSITIVSNTIYNAGIRKNQGDGIDIKGGLTSVTVEANEIYSIGTGTDPVRAIVSQGEQTGTASNLIIQRNYIHDISNIEDGTITIADSWGIADNVIIRNNIIDTCSTGSGILVYDTQSTGAFIYNNTIYNCSDVALDLRSGGIYNIRNNIFADNNSSGAQITIAGTITFDYNAYTDTLGYGSPGAHSISLGANANTEFTDAANSDFTLLTGASSKDTGVTISDFAEDRILTSRPQGSAWDIGAYEFISGGGGGGSTKIIILGHVVIKDKIVLQ